MATKVDILDYRERVTFRISSAKVATALADAHEEAAASLRATLSSISNVLPKNDKGVLEEGDVVMLMLSLLDDKSTDPDKLLVKSLLKEALEIQENLDRYALRADLITVGDTLFFDIDEKDASKWGL